jgi:hypothetical protein
VLCFIDSSFKMFGDLANLMVRCNKVKKKLKAHQKSDIFLDNQQEEESTRSTELFRLLGAFKELLRAWKSHCHSYSEKTRLQLTSAWTELFPLLSSEMESRGSSFAAGSLVEAVARELVKANVSAACHKFEFSKAAEACSFQLIHGRYNLPALVINEVQKDFVKDIISWISGYASQAFEEVEGCAYGPGYGLSS